MAAEILTLVYTAEASFFFNGDMQHYIKICFATIKFFIDSKQIHEALYSVCPV